MLLAAILGFVFLFGGPATEAQVVHSSGYCAADIHVADDTGRPLAAPVELLGPDGQPVRKITADQCGRAWFCDFGFGTHRILVGRDTCNPVMIDNVRILYPHASTYYVTLNRCPAAPPEPVEGCGVVVRVRNTTGGPIPSAEVLFSDGRRARTDSLGRTSLRLPVGSDGTLKVSAPGYSEEQEALRCDRAGRIERTVSLRLLDAPQNAPEPPCAVTVHTKNEGGRPSGTVVDLLTWNNSPVSRVYGDRSGVARFCDIGPGEYKIRVGDDTCNAVEIQGVRDRYPEVSNYAVTLTTCTEGSDVGGNACSLYFRVSSETGDPLPFVTVRRGNAPDGDLTDVYGRAYELLRYDQSATFTFSTEGYAAERVTVDCHDHPQRTQKVVLKRLKP